MTKERYKIIPASYLILLRDYKVLMLRRFNTGYGNGKYSLPSGHVEAGENFTQCMIREAKEEIGVDLETKKLKVAHVIHGDFGITKNNERVNTFFISEEWEGNIENMEPEKCDDLSWFDLNNLPENITPEVLQALENIRKDVFYSEFGWN